VLILAFRKLLRTKSTWSRQGRGQRWVSTLQILQRSATPCPQELWNCASHSFTRVMHLMFHTAPPATNEKCLLWASINTPPDTPRNEEWPPRPKCSSETVMVYLSQDTTYPWVVSSWMDLQDCLLILSSELSHLSVTWGLTFMLFWKGSPKPPRR
jgi:hypothetical protein